MKNRDGFSIVELIIAMVILTVGMLALGSTMGYMSIQIRNADLRTARQAAVTEMGEQVQTMKFDSVATVTYANALNINGYKVWRSVSSVNSNLKGVTLFSEGVGYRRGWQSTMRDTVTISLLRPFQ